MFERLPSCTETSSPTFTWKLGISTLRPLTRDVSVGDELARLRARRCVTKTIDDVIQSAFEQREEVLAGHAFHSHGPLEVEPELALQHPVYAFDLLLLAKLFAVADELGAAHVAAMLAGRLSAAFLDRAAGLVAPLALQKELHSFPAAQTAHRSTISCQDLLLRLLSKQANQCPSTSKSLQA